MMRFYDYTVSQIGSDGRQYITGMVERESIDGHGLRGGKAFDITLDHKKQTTTISKFRWIHGIPEEWETVKVLNEIIAESEIESLLKKYGVI